MVVIGIDSIIYFKKSYLSRTLLEAILGYLCLSTECVQRMSEIVNS
jgi:23S rRNA maturation mini-RNase III